MKKNSNHQAKLLDIVFNPNQILRNVSKEVSPKEIRSPEFQDWLKDLVLTMVKKDGAGLAAPHVGKNIRVFVADDNNRNIVLINPQITKKSWAKVTQDEGCLSVVNKKGELVYGPVSRHKKVNCSYLDEKGKLRKIKASNFLARIIQHENDHLNGILFIDHLSSPLPDLPDDIDYTQTNQNPA